MLIQYYFLAGAVSAITLWALFPFPSNRRRFDYLAISLLAVFFILAAFRGDSGVDTWSYKIIFNGKFVRDLGFLGIIHLVDYFDGNSDSFISTISFFQLGILTIVLWKEREKNYLLLSVFFLATSSTFIFFGYNVIRQGLAAYLLLLGTLYYPRKPAVMYILYGLAATIHFSAIAYFLFPLVDKIILQKHSFLFILICIAVTPLFVFVLSYLPYMEIFMEYSNREGNSNLFLKLIFACIIPFIFNKLRLLSEYPLTRFYCFGLGLFILTYQSPETAKRFLMYSSIALPLIFSTIYLRFPRLRSVILLLGITYGLFVLTNPSVRENLL